MSQNSEKSIQSKETGPSATAVKSNSSKKSNLKPFTFFLGFFVSAVCLIWVFGKLDWDNFLKEVIQMNPLFLFLGLALTLTHNFAMTGRWYFILQKLGKVKFWTAYWSLRISYFFNATLPARLGEPFRILYIKKFTKISVGRSIGAMAADRLLDFLSLVLILYLSAFVLGVRG
ncbi:MAG: lysylphosphatidylglycerol synthase transmembrane domain-containing protein, partial [Bdellovibrionota bacterium]